MCYRKIFIHHRCGHIVTSLVEECGKSLLQPFNFSPLPSVPGRFQGPR